MLFLFLSYGYIEGQGWLFCISFIIDKDYENSKPIMHKTVSVCVTQPIAHQ